MKSIIITGWGWHDYACAAAVALRKLSNADVQGKSMSRLGEFLEDTFKGNPIYDQVIIVGIGWRGEPDNIISLLKKIKDQGVKIIWFSTLDLPGWMPEEIHDYVEINVDYGADTLTEIVGKYFNEPYKQLLPLVAGNRSKQYMAWNMLFDTAMFYYRSYQNTDVYSEAIKSLAKGGTIFTHKQKEMIEHFKKYGNRELKGSSPKIQKLHEIINKVGPKDQARVLIQGESGTGKETVALQLHFKSPRKDEPMICFNCATMSTQLLESGWFGYSKNAFTGATKEHRGVFQEADGGTLFLDEIGDLPLEAQGALLRVLQERRFQRLGDLKEFEVDVRVIVATNRNLAQMVKDGKFREDLFHRLCVIPIQVPALREHPEDIREIANHFWFTWHRKRLSEEQISVLEGYHWPGNVRELHNFLERADIFEESDFGALLKEHIAMTNPADNRPSSTIENLEELMRDHACKMLDKYDGNISKTSEAMGISRNTLKKYIKQEINDNE